jgi:hypothetical protein
LMCVFKLGTGTGMIASVDTTFWVWRFALRLRASSTLPVCVASSLVTVWLLYLSALGLRQWFKLMREYPFHCANTVLVCLRSPQSRCA